MSEINIYKSGNTLSAIMFDSYRNKYKVFYDNEVLDILNIIKKHKSKIENVFYSGDDINFDLTDTKIILSDKSKLKKDKRFDFIFKYLEDKNYKLHKTRWQKVGAIGLAILISTIGIVSVKAANDTTLNDQTYSLPESTYSDDSALSLEDVNEIVEVNQDNIETVNKNVAKETNRKDEKPVLNEVKEQEKTNNTNDENISEILEDELDIGSMSDSEKLEYVKEHYGDIIDKYANTYGLDSNLITAIATQERGKHSDVVDSGGAIGLMQIQVGVWDGHSVTAYNYDTGKEETVEISLEKLKDVNFNIKIGCMIFQSYLKEMDDNVIAAIQSYNMGTGSVKKIIVTYATASGKTYDAIISNPDDTGWLDYRTSSFPGDPDYVENVSRYYSSDNATKVNVR